MSSRGFFLVAVLLLCACEQPTGRPAAPESRPEPVVVYASYTDENYLPSLFAVFTRDTGIPVTVRHRPEPQLVSEVIEKRGSPPADVLLTRSVHGVWQAADEGALLPLQSEKIAGTVPDWLRDPDGYWTAVGFAATDVVCNANNQSDCDSVEKYEDLGKPEFRSRLCLSSSSLAVNRSLIASLIADHGVRPAEIIVRGWIANLALPPFASDRELLQAIEAGTCAIGVVSGLAFHQFGKPTVAAKWPQPGYIGVEAVGIGRHARSPDAARQLVEWFIDLEAQAATYSASGLWPVNPAVRADPFDYPASEGRRNAGVAGANEVDAIKLAERAAWR
jgi:iron(III) transport system substrate-binding protein